MFFKDQQIGKYQILDSIGSGGFGSVYLARDVWINKKVAIKVPHKQGDNFEKLLREPRLLAVLDHPNIVSVITAEKTNDVFYIVMEYVDGTSLEQLLRKSKRVELKQALSWFLQINDAITYAHRKNILHRDIRPANVLISREGHVKVADLGTSRYLLDHPFASTRIGSPPYMAPEHFQGRATLQSDLYSFGVLMYECLTGTLPFFDKNPQRLAQLARQGHFKQPHEINDKIPTEMSFIVCKAMHRQQSQRYVSAQELGVDLKKVRDKMRQPRPSASQELAHLVDSGKVNPSIRLGVIPRDISTKEFSKLFCWNCNRPIQKRTQSCPHCNVSLD